MTTLEACTTGKKVLGFLKVGTDVYRFSTNGRNIMVSKSGSLIFSAISERDFQNNVAPVLSHVIGLEPKTPMMRLATKDGVFEGLLKHIRQNSDKVKRILLTQNSDEFQENMPTVDPGQAMVAYASTLRDINKTILSFIDVSQSMFRTGYSSKMYGAKTVTSKLKDIEANCKAFLEAETIEGPIEKSLGQLKYAYQYVKEKRATPSSVVICIDRLVENYNTIKTIISEMLKSFYDLYNIDSHFKKNTGFPATWFFNSLYGDFQYDYNNLIKNLMNMAQSERNVIEQLLALKVTLIGNKPCQII